LPQRPRGISWMKVDAFARRLFPTLDRLSLLNSIEWGRQILFACAANLYIYLFSAGLKISCTFRFFHFYLPYQQKFLSFDSIHILIRGG
jgi:hypothetical protein